MHDSLRSNAWLLRGGVDANSTFRLFCLPYAGAGGVVYSRWLRDFPKEIEVCPTTYPGRLSRLRERPFDSIASLVENMAPALSPSFDRPFALLGYSMGGLVAFELARWLRRHDRPLPTHLVVAACAAPQRRERQSSNRHLSDDEFIQYVAQRYGAIPDAVLRDPEMRKTVLTATRADLNAVADYRYEEEAPLPIPITAFFSAEDHACTADAADAWRKETSAVFETVGLSGGHFFIDRDAERFTTRVVSIAERDARHAHRAHG